MFLRKPSLLLTTFLMLSTAVVEMSHQRDLLTFTMEDTKRYGELYYINIKLLLPIVETLSLTISFPFFNMSRNPEEAKSASSECWYTSIGLGLAVVVVDKGFNTFLQIL